MNAVDLIVAQMDLECIGLNPSGLLCRIPGENPDDIHRLFVAKHDVGYSAFIRDDVPPAVIERLKAIDPSDLFINTELVSEVLYGTQTGKGPTWSGSAYRITEPFDKNCIAMVQHKGNRFVVETNDKEVSWAWSSRTNGRCAELATETVESYRRKGYATIVSAAWANHQLLNGRIPFYSHKTENLASHKLALRLGAKKFMDCVSYE